MDSNYSLVYRLRGMVLADVAHREEEARQAMERARALDSVQATLVQFEFGDMDTCSRVVPSSIDVEVCKLFMNSGIGLDFLEEVEAGKE